MGLFKVSVLMLLLAASTPLLYRQFATDKTITFMSSYYSNYKVIDQFLRQSAGHMDKARDYLPNSEQVKEVVDKLNKQFNTLLTSTPLKKDDSPEAERKSSSNNQEKQKKKVEPMKSASNFRMTSCPGEDIQVRLWSKDELAKYDGDSNESEVYLGFMGLVYNVTMNALHYGPGAEYSVFAGRDATRAFVTGNFTGDLNDDISDIAEEMFSHVESWASFYASTYPVLGRIEGRFFDSRGCGTAELGRVYAIFNKLAQEKLERNKQEKQLPECNSEWNGDLKSGRVWCSTKSGGIERDWEGVPRIYDDGQTKSCVCFNLAVADDDQLRKHLSQYPNCNPTSTECELTQ